MCPAAPVYTSSIPPRVGAGARAPLLSGSPIFQTQHAEQVYIRPASGRGGCVSVGAVSAAGSVLLHGGMRRWVGQLLLLMLAHLLCVASDTGGGSGQGVNFLVSVVLVVGWSM